MAGTGALVVEEVSKEFILPRQRFAALAPVSMTVGEHRFASVIGPSGCGKSTLFNIIAGLTAPSTGSVRVGGRRVDGQPGFFAYMLQKDLLLPWRTVLGNVVLGLEIRGVSPAVARAQALPLLHCYGLGGFESRYPSQLSGGMRQRVALLRTLLYDRDIVLLDEPLGALDAQTRAMLQDWLLEVFHDFRKTVLLVTHDIDEAIYLSDEVYVMSARPGRIRARIEVDLPRPRHRSLVTSAAFAGLKAHAMELLAAEVRRAAEQEAVAS